MVGKNTTFQPTCDAVERAASALLVVDMQLFFLDASSPTFTCGGVAILPTVKRLMEAFRLAKRPVIFTQHVHHPDDLDSGIMGWWWEGKCLEGSPESEIHPELAPMPGEKVISKHRYSAFYNTDLETVLRCLKVEDLVVSGVMTNCAANRRLGTPISGTTGSSFRPTEPDRSTRKCTWPAS